MKKPKFKWRVKDNCKPFHLMPGDDFELRHRQEFKNKKGEVIETREKVLLKETIKKYREVDFLGVFEVENWEGLEEGIGGVFGKSKGKKKKKCEESKSFTVGI